MFCSVLFVFFRTSGLETKFAKVCHLCSGRTASPTSSTSVTVSVTLSNSFSGVTPHSPQLGASIPTCILSVRIDRLICWSRDSLHPRLSYLVYPKVKDARSLWWTRTRGWSWGRHSCRSDLAALYIGRAWYRTNRQESPFLGINPVLTRHGSHTRCRKNSRWIVHGGQD